MNNTQNINNMNTVSKALTTLFIAGTVLAGPASAMTAGQAFDRYHNESKSALNRGDFATFCTAEANLQFIESEVPGFMTDSYRAENESNLASCRRHGYSVVSSLSVTDTDPTPSSLFWYVPG